MLGLGNILTKGGAVLKFPNEYSFNFDGSNDYLEIENNSALSFGTNAHTISAWAKIDALANYKTIVSKRQAGGTATDYNLSVGANGVVYTYNGSAVAQTATGVISTGSWFHYALVYSGSAYQLYINGSAVAWASGTSTSGASNSHDIGIGWDRSGNYWDGEIDEVAIWDTALSSDDIAKIGSKPVDFSKESTYATDRTSNLKLWLRAGDKALPEEDRSIARQDFYTDFDGSNDYIAIGSAIGDMSAKDVSVTVWFNSRNISDQKGIISQQDGTGTGRFLLYNESSKLKSFLGGAEHSVSTNLQANTWHHACYTMNSSTNEYKLYLDGQLGDSGTDAIESADGDFFIGTSKTLGSAVFDGAISNLALYNTTLDAQTISQMAKSRFTPMRDHRFSVVDFDGTNDYIDCGSDTSLDNIWAGGGTLTAWIYPRSDGEGDFGMIAVKRNGNTSGWYLATNDESGGVCDIRLRSARDTADGGWATTSREITLNQWNHIAISYDSDSDSNNPLIYVNGISVGVTENDTPSGSHSSDASDVFKIGGDAGDFTYDGSISSLAVYNTIKSAEEIYAIYQQGITYDESSLSGLVGYWRMGDDTSKAYPTIADSSSNSNDGTMTNMASDDIVQQMSAGYDLGSFESSSEEELGGELITASVSTGSGITSSSYITYDGGKMNINASGQDFYIQINNTADTSSQNFMYRLVVTVDSYTQGGMSMAGGSAGFNSFSVGDSFDDIIYPDSDGGSFQFRVVNYVAVISSISLKRITSSPNLSDTHPAIIDVTEPVLGVELVDDIASWNTASGITATITTSTNTVALESDNNNTNSVTAYMGTAGILNTNIPAGLHKISFTANWTNPPNIKSFRWYYTGSSFRTYTITEGLNTIYDVMETSNGNTHFSIQFTNENQNLTLSNISAKQIQGNVGTMTNQASSDLVYSSVLPDQSFLTGVNSAYNFIDLDGSNEFITVQDDSSLTVSTALSASIWVNHDTAGSVQAYVTNWDYPNAGRSYRIYYSSQIKIELSSAGASDTKNITASFTPVVGSWYHIAFTFDSGTVKIYINGESQTVTADAGMHTSLYSSNGVTLIGAVGNESTNTHYMNGKIGQTAIFNKVLSDTEVSAIYNLGRHGNLLDSYTDNLIGYWAMSALDAKTGLSDVGDGTIYDRSGNSNHGTATNTESADLKSSPNAEPNGYAKGDTNRSTTTP